MPQEALDKDIRIELGDLSAVALLAVSIAEVDSPVAEFDKTVIGDGHPVRVSAQVVKGLLRSFKRCLGIDDPIVDVELVEPALPALWALQMLGRWCPTQVFAMVGV